MSGASQSKPQRGEAASATVSLTCGIRDDGTLFFVDSSGVPMPDKVVEAAKKQNKDAILELIQHKCDEINDQIEALGTLHHETPDPLIRPQFIEKEFGEPMPEAYVPRGLGLLDKLLPSRRRLVEEANRAADERFRKASAEWERAKADFDKRLAERKILVESLIYNDVSAMERFLEERLQDIVWPRETIVTFEIRERGTLVSLDVDLPEIEDMPTKLAAVPVRGLKLSVKELTVTRVQRLYAEHIHGIVFRLIGEVFAALPTVQEVLISGYSQRHDPATAQSRDEYLLSVRVTRASWEAINFKHLPTLDVVTALNQFELRREMLKSGLLKPITPHT